jgi:Ala-tRNA(Pro) deacylase
LKPEVAHQPVLARESELPDVFPDCSLGAVPGFGQAYNLDLVWDDELGEQPCLYFEAGNHEELIQIEQYDFHQLFHVDELRGSVH